jgi:hypothetical protein
MAVAPSNFASARSNTVSVTINVGDVVFVLLNNADNTAPAGLLDNGGNSYSFLVSDSNAVRGASAIYCCVNAMYSASSVSFTAGHTPTIAVGTLSGATGIGIGVSSANTSTAVNAGNLTSKVASSYAISLLSFFQSGSAVTPSAGTGTLQTNQSSTSTATGCGIVTLAAATPGTFDPTVALAPSANWFAATYEVWSAKYDFYSGKIPPKQLEKVVYKLIPTLAGSGGGGTPVTPVPIGAVLKGGTTGVAYSETISAQGGSGTGYTYAVTGGSLPAGTSLAGSTGIISGTPTTVANYSFTITVTDSLGNFGTQSFTIGISAPSSSGGGSYPFLG